MDINYTNDTSPPHMHSELHVTRRVHSNVVEEIYVDMWNAQKWKLN